MPPVGGGAVVEGVLLRHPLPPRPARRLDEGRHAVAEEVVVLREVHDVQQDALVPLRVLHREVEPKSEMKWLGHVTDLLQGVSPGRAPRFG